MGKPKDVKIKKKDKEVRGETPTGRERLMSRSDTSSESDNEDMRRTLKRLGREIDELKRIPSGSTVHTGDERLLKP